MKIKEGKTSFIEYQKALVFEIIKSIDQVFSDLEFEKKDYKNLLTRAVFNVCCTLDGTSGFKVDHKEVNPILTFSDNTMAKGEVISCGGNSFMHEYVTWAIKQYFDAE